MKIQSSNTRQIYSFDPGRESRHLCPECSHLRKKSKDKCLSWEQKSNRGYCHNCGTAFFEFNPHEPKQYTVPEWKNKTELSDNAVKYFEGRMIQQETLNKMRIYTDSEFMPQSGKEERVVCFPYFYNDKLINIKYRTNKKEFKLVSGAELIFYNIDCLKDNTEVIIVEGEIDALTFIENGFDNVLSVPNGANKNLEYLDNCIELFNDIKTVYLATDQDTKGIVLRDELIRRLGAEKCSIVSFKDCKDANEYFIKYGDELKDVIKNAVPVPVKGIIEAGSIYADIRELYEKGVHPGLKINQEEIDKLITWESGRLAVVTGIPGHGKSEFIDHIICKLNMVHGWKCGFFTPENYPLKFHYRKLFEKLIGKRFSKDDASELEYDLAYDHIRNNFFYVLNEEDFSIKTILDSAKILVKTRGIKILVIDPYNKLDHKYTDSETQYISRFLDQIIKFAQLNDVLVFLIAHPVKMLKKDHGFEIPSLYSISGSANFYNKTDYGLTVHRKTASDGVLINEVEVHIQKVKYKHNGEVGIVDLKYNYTNGRFQKDGYDNSNWLIPGQPVVKLNPNYGFEFDKSEAPF